VQRLPAIAVDLVSIDFRSGVQQHRHDLSVVVMRRPMERRVADPAALMHGQRITLDALADNFGPPLSRGQIDST
jgi:hypothetical protein